MAIGNKKLAVILKLAAKNAEAASARSKEAEAENTKLRQQIKDNEKMARARAIATKLIVGDDVRREIDDKTKKMASQDLDVVEKALELGNTEAVLKLGEAITASKTQTGNRGEQALYDLLVTLI